MTPARYGAAVDGIAGFSLPELMITLAVFMMVLGGVVTTHLFGLKMFQLTQSKIIESDDARRAIGLLTDEIERAVDFQIGQGGTNYFTPNVAGGVRQGNSIQLYFGTNTNQFVRYYGGTDLKRMTNGGAQGRVLASALKTCLFSAEDYRGALLTNNPPASIVRVDLEFYYKLAFYSRAAATNLGESYSYQTRIARTAQD